MFIAPHSPTKNAKRQRRDMFLARHIPDTSLAPAGRHINLDLHAGRCVRRSCRSYGACLPCWLDVFYKHGAPLELQFAPGKRRCWREAKRASNSASDARFAPSSASPPLERDEGNSVVVPVV